MRQRGKRERVEGRAEERRRKGGRAEEVTGGEWRKICIYKPNKILSGNCYSLGVGVNYH